MVGIDISKWNGGIDFNKVKSEWQEADGNTFESVLNEAAKRLNVEI